MISCVCVCVCVRVKTCVHVIFYKSNNLVDAARTKWRWGKVSFDPNLVLVDVYVIQRI